MSNTIGKWDTVVIIHDEPRRALWKTVFPGAVVPVESMLTVKVNVPGHEGAEAYMLDIEALTLDQLVGVVDLLARKFGLLANDVWMGIDGGVPILAEGVTMTSSDQGMLFSLIDDDPFSDLHDEEEPCSWED